MNNQVNVKVLAAHGAIIPQYQTLEAAGADICAFVEESITLKSSEYAMIPTGLKFEIPTGYEIQVRPRSGLAAKFGVTVLNSPGTIDSDYRGEVKVILINHGKNDFVINNGDRIAQLILSPVVQAQFTQQESLNATERGSGGFGSTGI